MAQQITLTDQESTLRQLLLDVSDYVGTQGGQTKPNLRFTGGWVRDKLLGSTSVDIDIGIDTLTGLDFGTFMKKYLEQPEAKAKYTSDVVGSLAKIKANPEKSKHLDTITTRILGLDIDLVNLRKETYAEDSRNPQMEFGTPEEDALRRDATVNALFYNLSSSEVEDLTGRGLEDMKLKVIKTPLEPLQTFRDDPLRVLRAIRFASRLNYRIAAEDEAAMGESSIRDALRLKITRERVGVEIIKMLKGPRPHTALSLIDRLGLYNEVFTNPTDPDCVRVHTERWSIAYDQLLKIIRTKPKETEDASSLEKISGFLLRSSEDSEDEFLAWLVVCFIPWARVPSRHPDRPSQKKVSSAASIAAREGIKADNKMTKIVDDASSYLSGVVEMKNSVARNHQSNSLAIDRVSQGWAIRRWGSHWRTSVLYAMLTEVSESEIDESRQRRIISSLRELTHSGRQKILDEYATWLSALDRERLLDVDQLKPIVDGKTLIERLKAKSKSEIKSGPWMKKALDMTMEWQLRNSNGTNSNDAIDEVFERREELGIDGIT